MSKVSKQPVFKDGAKVSVNSTGDVGKVIATVSRVNGFWLKVEFKLSATQKMTKFKNIKGSVTIKYIRPGAVTKVR